ncbi:branched-chain amino acid ABC transporter permease [Aquabacterium humicola]|uniref:branched-chain amino acid ABC transporter permease n=1 Tax=Aquabacterium humicola TaxID=3237377 RepID=UPI003F753A9D
MLPLFASPYATMAMRDAMILGLFALSYDLVWGKGWLLTLGHTAFLGIGAYAFAIATTQWGVAPLPGMLLGVACSAGIAALFGGLLLFAGVRLQFFAIMTIALLMIVQQIATSWQSVTGGDVGILSVPPIVGGDARQQVLGSYALVVGCLAGVLLASWLVFRGPYGRILAAIGMNELRARSCGYRTAAHLLAIFSASAAVAGFAGALMAGVSGVVAPDVFSITLATEVMLWVAIGGRGTLLGPVLAAVALTRLQQQLSSHATEWWPLILGVTFLAFVMFAPRGLAGLLGGWRRRERSPAAKVDGKPGEVTA